MIKKQNSTSLMYGKFHSFSLKSQLDQCVPIMWGKKVFRSIKKAVDYTGANHQKIKQCIESNTPYKGYYFKYVDIKNIDQKD